MSRQRAGAAHEGVTSDGRPGCHPAHVSGVRQGHSRVALQHSFIWNDNACKMCLANHVDLPLKLPVALQMEVSDIRDRSSCSTPHTRVHNIEQSLN